MSSAGAIVIAAGIFAAIYAPIGLAPMWAAKISTGTKILAGFLVLAGSFAEAALLIWSPLDYRRLLEFGPIAILCLLLLYRYIAGTLVKLVLALYQGPAMPWWGKARSWLATAALFLGVVWGLRWLDSQGWWRNGWWFWAIEGVGIIGGLVAW